MDNNKKKTISHDKLTVTRQQVPDKKHNTVNPPHFHHTTPPRLCK